MNSTKTNMNIRLEAYFKAILFNVLLIFVMDAIVLPYLTTDQNSVLVELSETEEGESEEEKSEKETKGEYEFLVTDLLSFTESQLYNYNQMTGLLLGSVKHHWDISTPPPELV